VEQHEAITLIGAAVTTKGGVWADLGAGSGVFTRALASLLGPAGTVYAVDRNTSAVQALGGDETRDPHGATVRAIAGDFTQGLDLPRLDGVVLANALHYVPYGDQPRVVREVASHLATGAPMVIVEYDRRSANQWVPYPIGPSALARLARDSGLPAPTLLATMPSQYGGTIYSAVIR
jgi:SAM-dependent methyltransferase